jgi:hypothetical protein
MKITATVLSLVIAAVLSFSLTSEANSKGGALQRQEDLITACKVLRNVVASSDPSIEQTNIIVYRNAYRLLRGKITDAGQLQAEDAYFQKLVTGNTDLAVVISLGSGPRPVKGWRHMEVYSLLDQIEAGGLKLEDIKTTIKSKDILDKKQKPSISPSGGRP